MSKFIDLIKKRINRLGPGFITGAADDDPSGIATYTIAGAQFGYKLNWLSLFLTPLMISVQEMCGRIGLVSGRGLMGVIKKYYSKKLLIFTFVLLIFANVVNIGADLAIMADSLKMVFGQSFFLWLILITVITLGMEIFIPYRIYCRYLKWMGLTLCVYILTALLVKQNWSQIISYTFIPHIDFNLVYLMTMVGFLGTTISPYLFFWQATEEIEEEIKNGEVKEFDHKPKIYHEEISLMRKDTIVGMVFSNIITFFIILTAAATLFQNGFHNIQTPQEAAMLLKPLAGNFAYFLFTFGIIGIGLQSIPIFAGTIAYAFCEIFDFKMGLEKKWNQAKVFYLIIGLVTFLGIVFNFFHINSIQALYYAAIINGVIAVPLIFIILKLADNPKVVDGYKSPIWVKVFGWLAFIFMAIASILMFYTLFK